MAKRKVTYTVDERTLDRLEQAAARLGKPKSQIVREAIQDYAERIGRLSERERLRMLRLFDEHVAAIPDRPEAEVDEELETIRRARRSGGRRSAGEAEA